MLQLTADRGRSIFVLAGILVVLAGCVPAQPNYQSSNPLTNTSTNPLPGQGPAGLSGPLAHTTNYADASPSYGSAQAPSAADSDDRYSSSAVQPASGWVAPNAGYGPAPQYSASSVYGPPRQESDPGVTRAIGWSTASTARPSSPYGPARIVDPNVMPVSATEVGPAGPDTVPAVGMGAYQPNPAGPPSPYSANPSPYSAAPTPYPAGQQYPAGQPQYSANPPQFPAASPQYPGGAAPYAAGPQYPGGSPQGYVGPSGDYVRPDSQPAQTPLPTPPIVASPTPAAPKEDDDEEWDISHLAPDYTWKKIKVAFGYGPNEKIARDAYDEGQALFRDKKYDEAAKKFDTAIGRWPDTPLEEDAMFLQAECYFFADRYGAAQDAYDLLLKQHDNTRYLDTVSARLFAIATYWEKLDETSHHWPTRPNATDKTQPWFDTLGNALGAYQQIWLHDPTGPYADVAVMRCANIHFRFNEWEEAAYSYDMLIKNYPKSQYQKDAHLLCIQAKKRIYQGPKYDIKPLEDADRTAQQALRQFPGQLGPEEARIREERAHFVEQRAEREWTVAQYYDRKKEFAAARLYYKGLITKYPTTHLAEQARTRMQEIQNEPDVPPNHFIWLTKIFGDEK